MPQQSLTKTKSVSPQWKRRFLKLLPQIEGQLSYAFRRLDPEQREERIQEAVVRCLLWYRRLYEQRKAHLAFPTVLARHAVRHIRAGRQVGCRLNVRDVLSPYAQRQKRFHVERLDRQTPARGDWLSALIADRRTPIPEQVALKLDVPAWLATLARRERRIARLLVAGERAGAVARRFRLSDSRLSQIRREMFLSWHRFVGSDMPPATA